MKKKKRIFGIKFFAIAIAFAAVIPAEAGTWGSVMKFVKKYQVTLPTGLHSELKGRRDVTNSDYLAGYGLDVVWLKRKDQKKPILYFSADHLFNASQKGRGSIGGSIGLGTGKAGQVVDKTLRTIAPKLADRMVWFGKLSNFISIEIGGGYNTGTMEAGQKRFHWGYGGKLKIPTEKFFKLFKSPRKTGTSLGTGTW